MREAPEDNEAAVVFAVKDDEVTTVGIVQVGPVQHTTLDD